MSSCVPNIWKSWKPCVDVCLSYLLQRSLNGFLYFVLRRVLPNGRRVQILLLRVATSAVSNLSPLEFSGLLELDSRMKWKIVHVPITSWASNLSLSDKPMATNAQLKQKHKCRRGILCPTWLHSRGKFQRAWKLLHWGSVWWPLFDFEWF